MKKSKTVVTLQEKPDTYGNVYLVFEREHFRIDEPVYKIGKTTQELHLRIKDYDKGSMVKVFADFDDCHSAEEHLIKVFIEKFGNPVEGKEYFVGDVTKMIRIITDYQQLQLKENKVNRKCKIDYSLLTVERIRNAVNKLYNLLTFEVLIKNISTYIDFNCDKNIKELCHKNGICIIKKISIESLWLIYNNATKMDMFWKTVDYLYNLFNENVTIYIVNLETLENLEIGKESIEIIKHKVLFNNKTPNKCLNGIKKITINNILKEQFPNYREDIKFGGKKQLFNILYIKQNNEEHRILYQIVGNEAPSFMYLNYKTNQYTKNFHDLLFSRGILKYGKIYDVKDIGFLEKINSLKKKYNIDDIFKEYVMGFDKHDIVYASLCYTTILNNKYLAYRINKNEYEVDCLFGDSFKIKLIHKKHEISKIISITSPFD